MNPPAPRVRSCPRQTRALRQDPAPLLPGARRGKGLARASPQPPCVPTPRAVPRLSAGNRWLPFPARGRWVLVASSPCPCRRTLLPHPPLLNEHKIFPCCQLLGSFVLLWAVLVQGKSHWSCPSPRGVGEAPVGSPQLFLRWASLSAPCTPSSPHRPRLTASPRPQCDTAGAVARSETFLGFKPAFEGHGKAPPNFAVVVNVLAGLLECPHATSQTSSGSGAAAGLVGRDLTGRDPCSQLPHWAEV